MSSVIYKYQLGIAPMLEVGMPAGARILSVGVQGTIPCLWALVDPAGILEVRRIRTLATGGRESVDGCSYLGTYQLPGTDWEPPFVGHLFEVLTPATSADADSKKAPNE